MSVAIVGRGRVGTALYEALRVAGVDVSSLSSRALPAETHADLYVLATRDAMLPTVARAVLAVHRGPAPTLLHTAGAIPSSVLRDAGARSAAVLHPLVAFAGGVPPLEGALFAIEGDDDAVPLAMELVAHVGGRPQRLTSDQLARYHAAAVLASNHVLALVQLGREMLVGLGINDVMAQAGLASLFAGVARNLIDQGLPQALTGPIARGDVATVRRHLEALADAPEALHAYVATAGTLCRIARAQAAGDLDAFGEPDGVAQPDGVAKIEALLRLYPVARVD